MAKKQTCDNCYHYVCPKVGRIVPHYECLADDSERGGESTQSYQEANGRGCPHWQPQAMRIRR